MFMSSVYHNDCQPFLTHGIVWRRIFFAEHSKRRCFLVVFWLGTCLYTIILTTHLCATAHSLRITGLSSAFEVLLVHWTRIKFSEWAFIFFDLSCYNDQKVVCKHETEPIDANKWWNISTPRTYNVMEYYSAVSFQRLFAFDEENWEFRSNVHAVSIIENPNTSNTRKAEIELKEISLFSISSYSISQWFFYSSLSVMCEVRNIATKNSSSPIQHNNSVPWNSVKRKIFLKVKRIFSNTFYFFAH